MSRACSLASLIVIVVSVAVTTVIATDPAAAHGAMKCYSCKGFTGDGMCGTPFNDAGLRTCRGASCVVNRSWKVVHEEKKQNQKPSPNKPCAIWEVYDNAGSLGGIPNTATSLNACQLACFYGDRCAAAEWNPRNPLGRNCLLHSNALLPSQLLSSTETTRFQLNKPPNCPPCGIQWIASNGMYYSTTKAQNLSSLDGCLATCINTPDCVGVDWNSTAGNAVQASDGAVSRGNPCSLLKATVYTTRYTIDDVMTHYDIIRNTACKGGYETITRDCSRSFARLEPSCRPMRGIRNGISCSCSSDMCNGDDYGMMTDDYAVSIGAAASLDGLDGEPSALAVGGGEASVWRYSAAAFKANKWKQHQRRQKTASGLGGHRSRMRRSRR